MNDMITEQEFEDYRNLKNEYTKIVNTKILEDNNKIVQIGAYTASIDEKGNVELSRTQFPSQFTEDVASKILNMNWVSNSEKKPTLEILNVKDWYQNRIKALDSILTLSKQNGCKKKLDKG